jgi:competence protein ComEA
MVQPNRSPNSESRQPLWLRRADQVAVAGLILITLVAMIGYWVSQGGAQGRLIEIDRAGPLQAQFAVDINKADFGELTQVPGIGETLARRIVALRAQNGPFTDHDDLLRVKGIGRKTLDRMRPFLLPMAGGGTVAER